MTEKKRTSSAELVKLAGRRDWNGIKPITRVIPNKKKAKPQRKAKHKGRNFDSGPFFCLLSGRGFTVRTA